MSKTIPIALQAHKALPATTLCDLLRIGPLENGETYGFTSLGKDVTYDDGDGPIVYRAHTGFNGSAQIASADLSVDNAEAESLEATYTIPGVSQSAIDLGLFDKAPFVMYRVNYEDLADGHEVLASGTVGEQTLKVGGIAVLELRSLSQQLKQSIVELDSLTCRVKKFGSQPGDERFPCGYNITAEWVDFTVSEVGTEPTRMFRALELVEADDYFAPGLIEWQTGDNAGQQVEIESYESQAETYQVAIDFEGSGISDEGGHVWTQVGNAAIVSDWAQFGTQSLRLDGVGDRITTPDSDDFHFGTGTFTVELWVRFDGAPTNAFLIGQWGATVPEQGWYLYLNGGILEFNFRDTGGTLRTVSSAWVPATLTPYHVAVCRDSLGVIRVFADGVVLASATRAENMQNATATLNIGGNVAIGAGYDLDGWVDGVGLAKGAALYAAAFTPPTAAPTNNTGGLVTAQFTLPESIQIGDTGRLRRDCTRAWAGHNSCATYWGTDKGLHFRGEPYIPVGDPVMVPGAGQ